MTISNVSSALSSYQADVLNPWQQRAQDFKSLQSSLQSGDLSGAQQAFTALQKDQQNSSTPASGTSATSQNTAVSKDFQALQSALSSGDLSGAQQAFASLKQDMKSTSQARHHHHHHGGSAGSATSAASATSGASATQSVGGSLNVQA